MYKIDNIELTSCQLEKIYRDVRRKHYKEDCEEAIECWDNLTKSQQDDILNDFEDNICEYTDFRTCAMNAFHYFNDNVWEHSYSPQYSDAGRSEL